MTAKNIDGHELGLLVAEAYNQGKGKAFDELLYVLADPHGLGCGCQPCVIIEAVALRPSSATSWCGRPSG